MKRFEQKLRSRLHCCSEENTDNNGSWEKKIAENKVSTVTSDCFFVFVRQWENVTCNYT